jgi:hypothetical protein
MSESIAIGSRSEFRQAVLDALAAAVDRRARSMWWMDATFEHWPLDEPALIHLVDRWVHLPQRRLLLFAADFDVLARTHSRFVHWRRHWTHCVMGRKPVDLEPASIETMLVTDAGTLVALQDPQRFLGARTQGGLDVGQAMMRIDAISQRSEEAFTTVVLGI